MVVTAPTICSAAPGDDTLLGGTGNDDELDGGTGADHLDGGDGRLDAVLYGSRTNTVSVNLQTGSGPSNASTNNGESGERDTIVNAEEARGGDGNDVLVGNDLDNNLLGFAST